jgi:c(7)-type cytochrome triheme protein
VTMTRRSIPHPMAASHAASRMRSPVRWLLLVVLVCMCAVSIAAAQKWLAIGGDDLHDPHSPAIGVLQEPAEALGALGAQAPDAVGNQVRWMQALDKGLIQPRTNILPETKVNLRTTDVLLMNTAHMPLVKFPHRQHTEWLDCANCHDQIFKKEAGKTKIGMFSVLAGEKCGLCHGAVAFPLTECNRCHSVERNSADHRSFQNQVRDLGKS